MTGTAGGTGTAAGIALHRYVLPIMASSAGTGLPASLFHVYRIDGLVALGLPGLVIAAMAAMASAGWTAKITTASALRAE